MDIFKLLSRGANIQKNGKHQEQLNIFNGKAAVQNVASENKKRSDLDRDIDFFRTEKKSDSKQKQKGKKRHSSHDENEEDENDIEDDAEDLPLVISTPELAAAQRKKLNVNIKGDDLPLPIGSFEDLKTRFDLHKHLLRNLHQQNFNRPTPIQSEAIPLMLMNRDIVACAPTGSGKTLAFSIPIVQSLNEHDPSGIRCLIVTPTKELATQIYNEIVKLSRGRDLRICVLTKSQAAKFHSNIANGNNQRRKYDILISTPLRLLSITKTGAIDLSKVQHIVLDEADKLFEEGFIDQTDSIIEQCTSPKLQKALFSATIPSGVEEIANNIMISPVRVIIGRKEGASTTIDQKLMYTGNEQGKLIAIRQMLSHGELPPPVVIFVQSIQRAKALFHELIYDKVNVDVIHGERTQNQRDQVISRFKNGDIWVLICTDVLSRGIDFRGVNVVLNYDVPQTAQSYVHRIGRTGRAGRQGKSITFFTKEDSVAVKAVVNVMKQSGCDVQDWMLKMGKATSNEKKSLKKKPVERTQISSVPSVVRQKRKNQKEMIEASKKRKLEGSDSEEEDDE
ncbi:hypothetical protein DV495_000367 [Geotrichum candidum]|uniref:RNA helicase n=1 Tax=Geotrichum candidum TaxID=1173061 RepID=A0A0J9X726_GEOCN|nr:hypothetical protein DV454_002638 [Geotrichum candidum]KAF5135946.1 hypothetical protein DV495_000367 [Geotrichum candidum]KAF7500245.1 hypothetical protein DV113_001711 [Geotrichum candidum]KAI9214174.1 hypothetical protein DS838_000926 [Geotrichum bryndzae]CDO52958.1 similar to Saccharomyces cerevisiae YGL171W ROK1 ATP-dependent RNA helicase of the DEAD box family [Geotrichum candidum]